MEFWEYKTLSLYTHTPINTCKKHARKLTYTPINACIQTYTRAYTHIRTQTQANIHTHAHKHTHAHTHTHISARECTHKHTQCPFVVGDPSLRNHLPDNVKEAGSIEVFKQIRKTFVFSQSFEKSAFLNL